MGEGITQAQQTTPSPTPPPATTTKPTNTKPDLIVTKSSTTTAEEPSTHTDKEPENGAQRSNSFINALFILLLVIFWIME